VVYIIKNRGDIVKADTDVRQLKPGSLFRYKGKVLTVGPAGIREYVRIYLTGGGILAVDPGTLVELLVEIDPALLARVAKARGDGEAKARQWMLAPNIALKGRTPQEVAQTEEGIKQIDSILSAIDYGGVV
jgi:hypothetical protein